MQEGGGGGVGVWIKQPLASLKASTKERTPIVKDKSPEQNSRFFSAGRSGAIAELAHGYPWKHKARSHQEGTMTQQEGLV